MSSFSMATETIVARNYDRFVRQIARILWGMCDHETEDVRGFCHCNENNLNAPCDMLARLGIMHGGTVSHRFVANWSPFGETPSTRHAGEPTAQDLWLGLTFLIEWCPQEAALSKRGQVVVGIETDFGDLSRLTTARIRYRIWAVQGACELLHSLALGAWSDDSTFRICDPDSTADDIEDYWSSRNEMIRQLGRVELLYPETCKT